jgi:hypothetical protein
MGKPVQAEPLTEQRFQVQPTRLQQRCHLDPGLEHPSPVDSQFFEPDPTNEFFPSLSLEKQYEIVSQYCNLHDGVPDDVHSYFNAVVMLYLYGWLYYPFYTLASERSFFAVEMALRTRLPPKELDEQGRDMRTLTRLLREAKKAGLLRDEGFPSLENRRAIAEELNQHVAEILGRDPEPQREVPYVDVLIQRFPWVRNRFAHPDMQNIMPPGTALDGLILAAEIISQLWPKPDHKCTPDKESL